MSDQSGWPSHVEPISMKDLDRLGVDLKHNLYWDGVPVVTDAKVVLSNGQRWAAIAVGLCAVLGALGSFVQGWVAYNDLACKMHWSTGLCP